MVVGRIKVLIRGKLKAQENGEAKVKSVLSENNRKEKSNWLKVIV
jgi:hypothetical protein